MRLVCCPICKQRYKIWRNNQISFRCCHLQQKIDDYILGVSKAVDLQKNDDFDHELIEEF